MLLFDKKFKIDIIFLKLMEMNRLITIAEKVLKKLNTPPIVKGKAEPGSPSKSSSLPAYLSNSRLWLSMYEDLASLMDFSATPVDA